MAEELQAVQPTEPDDELDSQESDSEWYLAKRLGVFAWPLRGRLVLMVMLIVARAAALGLVIYFLHRTLHSLLPEQGDAQLTLFAVFAAALLACQIAAAVCQYLSEEAQRWFLNGVEAGVLHWVLGQLLLLPADYFRKHSIIQLVLRAQRLQFVVRMFLTSSTTVLMRGCTIAGIAAGVVPQAPLFAGVTLGLLAGLVILVRGRANRLRRLAQQDMEVDCQFADQVLGIFTNVRELHHYGLRDRAVVEFRRACREMSDRSQQIGRILTGAGVWIHLAGAPLLAGMLGLALCTDTSTASALTCFAALAMLIEPLSDITRSITELRTRSARFGALFQMFDEYAAERKEDSPKAEAAPIESLAFKRVSYALGGVPILRDLNFEVKRGEIVGIVGRSGAGKTTLGCLALRLLKPTGGRILLNGGDVRELDPASCWRQSAYIAQAPCRIGGTVVEEVALVRPEATALDIRQALEEAGIEPSLGELKLDADSLNTEGGQSLWHTRSLQQRVEWARLRLRPARLVILDEPTSLVDPIQEQRLVQSLLRERGERITLLISHRPATLAICDRLLVLDNGRLVAQGTRDEILPRWMPELQNKAG